MLRAVLGVVVGYITMAVLVFAGLSAAYVVMGADVAFEPDVHDVSTTWIITSFVIGFAAAIAGGMVCVLIARSPGPAFALAGVVLVIGLAMALPIIFQERPVEPEVRYADLPMWETIFRSKQPLYVSWANPIVGVVGVIVGAAIVNRKRSNRREHGR